LFKFSFDGRRMAQTSSPILKQLTSAPKWVYKWPLRIKWWLQKMRAYTTVRAGGSKKAMLPLCFNIQTPTAQITTFSPLTMDLLVQNVPYSPNIMFGVLFIITRHLSVIMSLRGWLYVTIVSCQKTVVYWSVGYGSSARRLN